MLYDTNDKEEKAFIIRGIIENMIILYYERSLFAHFERWEEKCLYIPHFKTVVGKRIDRGLAGDFEWHYFRSREHVSEAKLIAEGKIELAANQGSERYRNYGRFSISRVNKFDFNFENHNEVIKARTSTKNFVQGIEDLISLSNKNS